MATLKRSTTAELISFAISELRFDRNKLLDRLRNLKQHASLLQIANRTMWRIMLTAGNVLVGISLKRVLLPPH
jgi:hypothetical protein